MNILSLFFSEDDKSVSSESSDGSDAYLDNVPTRKEGWHITLILILLNHLINVFIT